MSLIIHLSQMIKIDMRIVVDKLLWPNISWTERKSPITYGWRNNGEVNADVNRTGSLRLKFYTFLDLPWSEPRCEIKTEAFWSKWPFQKFWASSIDFLLPFSQTGQFISFTRNTNKMTIKIDIFRPCSSASRKPLEYSSSNSLLTKAADQLVFLAWVDLINRFYIDHARQGSRLAF